MTDTYYFSPPAEPVPDSEEAERINDLRTKFADGGWLSTLVWNSRNSYLAWPESKLPASQVRMIVEGFLAEIERLRGGSKGHD